MGRQAGRQCFFSIGSDRFEKLELGSQEPFQGLNFSVVQQFVRICLRVVRSRFTGSQIATCKKRKRRRSSKKKAETKPKMDIDEMFEQHQYGTNYDEIKTPEQIEEVQAKIDLFFDMDELYRMDHLDETENQAEKKAKIVSDEFDQFIIESRKFEEPLDFSMDNVNRLEPVRENLEKTRVMKSSTEQISDLKSKNRKLRQQLKQTEEDAFDTINRLRNEIAEIRKVKTDDEKQNVINLLQQKIQELTQDLENLEKVQKLLNQDQEKLNLELKKSEEIRRYQLELLQEQHKQILKQQNSNNNFVSTTNNSDFMYETDRTQTQ